MKKRRLKFFMGSIMAAFMVCVVMLLSNVGEIYASANKSWNSLDEYDANLKDSAEKYYTLRNVRFKIDRLFSYAANQTINTNLYENGTSRDYNVLSWRASDASAVGREDMINARIVLERKFTAAVGQRLQIVAATADGMDSYGNAVGGVPLNDGKEFYYCITEWTDDGQLVFDSAWQSTAKEWYFGNTPNGYYPVGSYRDTRPLEARKFVLYFRWNTGDTALGNGTQPISASDVVNAFQNIYIVHDDFTYTFDANGGTINGGNRATMKRFGLTPAMVPGEPVRAGYTFKGWLVKSDYGYNVQDGYVFTTDELNTMFNDGKYYSSLFDNATFTAQWERNSANVNYKPDGGSINSSSDWTVSNGYIKKKSDTSAAAHTVSYGESVTLHTLSDFKLSRAGYEFAGWYNPITGKVLTAGKTYSYSELTGGATDVTTMDVDLTAVWKMAEKINITIDPNGGRIFPDLGDWEVGTSEVYTFRATSGVMSDFNYYTPVRDGYEFYSFGLVSGDAVVYYYTAEEIWRLKATEDSVLKAKWTPGFCNYRVEHYKMNVDGTYPSSPTDITTGSALCGSEILPGTKDYGSHFIAPEEESLTISVNEEENVIKYYYERRKYTVYLTAGTGIDRVIGGGTYYYGATATIDATVKPGYKWVNWTNDYFDGDELTTDRQYSFTVTWNQYFTANAEINTVGATIRHFVMNTDGTYPSTPTKTVEAQLNVDSAFSDYGDDYFRDSSLEIENKIYFSKCTYPSSGVVSTTASENVVNVYYARKAYTVILSAGTGISGVSGGGTYYYGATASIDATVKSGYKWVNWTGSVTTTTKNYSFTVDDNKSLTANAEIDYVDAVVRHYVMEPNGEFPDTPTKTSNATLVVGKSFADDYGASYFKDSSLEVTVNGVKVIYMSGYQFPTSGVVSGNSDENVVEVYYIRKSFRVAYNAAYNGGVWDNGSVADRYETVYYGANADLSYRPSKADSEFVGWNTEKDATTALTSVVVEGDITLYAVYKTTITVGFNDAQGRRTASAVIYNRATEGTIYVPYVRSYDGWKNVSGVLTVGWTSSNDVTDANGATGELAEGKNVTVSGSREYYAIYKATATVTFDENGGKPSDDTADKKATVYKNASDLSVTKGAAMTLPDCERDEVDNGNGTITTYLLKGWKLSGAEDTSEIHEKGSDLNVTQNTDLVAVWDSVDKVITYTIDFDMNGGKEEYKPDPITATYGTEVTLSGDVSRVGFTFMEWNTKPDGTGTGYVAGEAVKNLTTVDGATVMLYAQWRQRDFMLIKIGSSRYGATFVRRTLGDDTWFNSTGKITVNQWQAMTEEERDALCVQKWSISKDGTITRVK